MSDDLRDRYAEARKLINVALRDVRGDFSRTDVCDNVIAAFMPLLHRLYAKHDADTAEVERLRAELAEAKTEREAEEGLVADLRDELDGLAAESQARLAAAEEDIRRARGQRDALKAATGALKDDALFVARHAEENAWPDSNVAIRARRLIAALDAPETPGDADAQA